MDAVIEAHGVSRTFGKVQAVRHADVRVAPGEITALVGPNGCGKTTLMLMLATLLRPDQGEVRINGHNTVTDTLAARAGLGWMPDTLGAWPALTVRETITAVCSMYGLRGRDAATRTEAMLALTGLTELAAQRSATLSRGQKQRLSLARALVHQPSALLLDEPASGLDPEARLTQRRMLLELAAQGVAILVTSHVLDELNEMATQVVFMRDGVTAAPDSVDAALQQTGQWRVRALDDAALRTALAELGITSTSRPALGGTQHLIAAADDVTASRILGALVAAGVPIIDFSPAASALEQAFVQLAHDTPQRAPEDRS